MPITGTDNLIVGRGESTYKYKYSDLITSLNSDLTMSGSGLQGADAPLGVNGSNVKLNYSSGLTNSSGNLITDLGDGLNFSGNKIQANLGEGLTFDSGKIKLNFKADQIETFKPQAGRNNSFDTEKWGGGGTDSPGARRNVEVPCAAEANGFISIITWRWAMQPNEDADYGPSGTFAINRVQPTLCCKVHNRSANALTSDTGSEVSLNSAATISFNGAHGRDNQNWMEIRYETRIDEWTCNAQSGNIRFEFFAKNVVHNKTKFIYNGGCRVAIIPFKR